MSTPLPNLCLQLVTSAATQNLEMNIFYGTDDVSNDSVTINDDFSSDDVSSDSGSDNDDFSQL